MLEKVLQRRGLLHVDEYINPTAKSLHNPFLLKDMNKAYSTIKRHLSENNLIYIYGDYDADGVSSTSLMIRLMQKLNARHMYRVPNREKDGYGLHMHIVDEAIKAGASLIITVDTGISAANVVDYAKTQGLSVVITDHHEPPSIIPKADAVVNPKRIDCRYPFKGLAGVGVAYKLATALLGRNSDDLLEYVALGTVADIMPLTGENRYMVKRGLEVMTRGEGFTGLACLKAACGIDAVSATDIGFKIGPMINAAGRLYDASLAVELLITDDESFAYNRAAELTKINKERQELVKICTQQAKEIVEEHNLDDYKVIVVYSNEWKSGVVGLIASAMVEAYDRPAIVMHKHGNLYKGSCRSHGDFDLYESLSACSHLLEYFGGHKGAAGMGILLENIKPFTESIHILAEYDKESAVGVVDAVASITDFKQEMLEEISVMEPCGEGNRPPLLSVEGYLTDVRAIGKEKTHYSGVLSSVNDPFIMDEQVEIIQFKAWEKYKHIKRGSKVTVVGYPSSGYNGVNIMAQSIVQIIT